MAPSHIVGDCVEAPAGNGGGGGGLEVTKPAGIGGGGGGRVAAGAGFHRSGWTLALGGGPARLEDGKFVRTTGVAALGGTFDEDASRPA